MRTIKITIKEVAKRAEISVSTVSNVINGKAKCSEATKERVLKIIKESGYKPNQAARTLVNKKSNLIGMLIFNKEEALVENRFYQKVTNSIISELSKKNCDLIIGDGERNIEILDWIRKRDLEGLIIIGHLNIAQEKKLKEVDISVVFIDNYEEKEELNSELAGKEKYGYVTSDDTIAGYEATELLINRGCRNIAFIGDENSPTHERRYLGYQTGIVENLMGEDIKINSEISYEAGEKLVEELLLDEDKNIYKNIDGICVASDTIAFGIMNKLKKYNIETPKTIKIIGFDNSDYCNYMSPKLTSVDLNFAEKGKKAVEIIFNQLDKKTSDYLKNISIDLTITERESTK